MSQTKAAQVLGLSVRTLERWGTPPWNALLPEERAIIAEVVARRDCAEFPAGDRGTNRTQGTKAAAQGVAMATGGAGALPRPPQVSEDPPNDARIVRPRRTFWW